MMRLAVVSLLVLPTLGAPPKTASFSVYSRPIYLRRGEVHNAYLEPAPLPAELQRQFANRTTYFRSLQLDIVRLSGGHETSLPLYETYNHHHALILGTMVDLQRVHNLTNGTDPLGPRHSHENLHTLAHGRGCSVRGEHLEHLLALAAEQDGYSRIVAFGGASGAEFRGTSTALPLPFVYSATNLEGFMPLLHFINTRGVPHSRKLWECPCTSARHINVTAGTVDGVPVIPFHCSKELQEQHNPSCSLSTYTGGYRCCEHGVFLVEDPDISETPDEIQAKFTFEYYTEVDGSSLSSTAHVSCCDVTFGGSSTGIHAESYNSHKNLEYAIPRCATPPCEHVLTSVEAFDGPNPYNGSHYDPDEEMELVHAWGHQHIAGLGLELRRESTGELLCATRPNYGNGSAAGNEDGFLVGIPPCVFGPPPLAPPPRVRRGELMRTVSRYDASENHTGVMGIWILTAAPVKRSTVVWAQKEPILV